MDGQPGIVGTAPAHDALDGDRGTVRGDHTDDRGAPLAAARRVQHGAERTEGDPPGGVLPEERERTSGTHDRRGAEAVLHGLEDRDLAPGRPDDHFGPLGTIEHVVVPPAREAAFA